jgi:hypothetical protein
MPAKGLIFVEPSIARLNLQTDFFTKALPIAQSELVDDGIDVAAKMHKTASRLENTHSTHSVGYCQEEFFMSF